MGELQDDGLWERFGMEDVDTVRECHQSRGGERSVAVLWISAIGINKVHLEEGEDEGRRALLPLGKRVFVCVL